MAEPAAVFPHEHLPLNPPGLPPYMHAVELAACLGLGQRALIVGPPASGKTTLLRDIARAAAVSRPSVEIHVLLIDQRVEEFAEWPELVPSATLHGTSSDASIEEHTELDHVFDEASERALAGSDTLILVDSLAALVRAYNATHEVSDRVLSGGLLATALVETRKRFGLARAYESGGSVTMVATASVDTERELDTVVFHELVGTGNMELHLSAQAAQVGVFPPLDLSRSGTRREEDIIGEEQADLRARLRSHLLEIGEVAGVATLLDRLGEGETLQSVLAGAAAG